jgi:endoglucanase
VQLHPSDLRYGQLTTDPLNGESTVISLCPDPWHAPALCLKSSAWRKDATSHAYLTLSLYFEDSRSPGFIPRLSFWGWFCGSSSSISVGEVLPDPIPSGEWIEVAIPTSEFSSQDSSPTAIEWLYFGAGELRAPVYVKDIQFTDSPPEPLKPEPVPSPFETDGIPAVHVLSAEWVAVILDPAPSYLEQLDRLSSGHYRRLVERNARADKQGNLPEFWVTAAELRQMRQLFGSTARKNSLEGNCRETGFYSLSSATDTRYGQQSFTPRQSSLHYISVDEGKAALGDVRYGIVAYLQMPFSMQSGNNYTVQLLDGTAAEFYYDEDRTISRAIKVSQIGYRPGDPANAAYLGAWLGELGALAFAPGLGFEVVEAETREVVLTGRLEERTTFASLAEMAQPNPHRLDWTGEHLYSMDLSQLLRPGVYYIRIPGVGRSWSFVVDDASYGEAFFVAARGLYHQRAGTSLEAPFTAWTRPAIHNGPIFESAMLPYWADSQKVQRSSDGATIVWPRFDIIGATLDTTRSTAPVAGGWHDAADFDRNLFHYAAILDLLALIEWAPGRFTDCQLNIPESGNGIPDLLDEAEYGLRIWRASQLPSGGVAGMVESWTHPQISETDAPYAFSRRTAQSSLLYAGTAAKLARLLRPYDPDLAAGYLESALAAFAFGEAPENAVSGSIVPAATQRGRGEPYTVTFTPAEGFLAKYRLFARTQLFLATRERGYLENLPQLYADCPAPYAWPLSMRDFSPWLTFDLIGHPDFWRETEAIPAAMRERLFRELTEPALNLLPLSDWMPYRQTWPVSQDYWLEWGASDHTNQIRALAIAHRLSPDPEIEQAITRNLHYMFGCNPMGMSWTTGIGEVYPVALQHAVSQSDGLADPVPGLTVYGVTSWHMYPQFRDWVTDRWTPPEPYPVARRWAAHPYLNTAQNEFTVHESIASTVFALGYSLVEGWLPSQELLRRKPRPASQLHGFWYLP